MTRFLNQAEGIALSLKQNGNRFPRVCHLIAAGITFIEGNVAKA
ncbi:hypothetical protein BN126_1236 [Cronobacter sakazakii 680]|nr:hypothetical protein BN126_1236 [Cronobacter sakazakii 680]